jgi:periplasmic protein TonB
LYQVNPQPQNTMDRHFVLPATIAAAVHAGLFFGFPSRSGQSSAPPTRPTAEVCPPTITIQDNPSPDDVNQLASNPEGGTPMPDLIDPLKPTTKDDFPVIVNVDPSAVKPLGPITQINESDRPGRGKIPGPYVQTHIVSDSMLDTPPYARFQMSPSYPPAARADGRSGDVTVEFTVDEKGHVVEPHVMNSTDSVFDGPALQAVAKWRFDPGMVHGRIVRFRMAVPLVFRLNDE